MLHKHKEWHNEHEANISRRSDAHKSEVRAKKVYVPVVKKVEEIKVVTKLTMPSRRLKVKISAELLQELEKMQINFKLN